MLLTVYMDLDINNTDRKYRNMEKVRCGLPISLLLTNFIYANKQ